MSHQFTESTTVESVEHNTKRTDKQVLKSEQDNDAILNIYRTSLLSGDTVTVRFEGAFEDATKSLEIGNRLAEENIEYTAMIKFKDKSNKGTYNTVSIIEQLALVEGFDVNIDVKLKINDKSSIDFANTESWLQDDAIYVVKPKARASDVGEITPFLEHLQSHNIAAYIAIKPKTITEENLPTLLDILPDGLDITITRLEGGLEE